MKKLLALAVAVSALALGGCGTMFGAAPQLAVPTTLSEVGQQAAKLINEAKVDLIAANQAIASQSSAGLMTKADAVSLSQKVDVAWEQVKAAEKLLAGGSDVLAKNQAQLLSGLLTALQKEVIARSKKGT